MSTTTRAGCTRRSSAADGIAMPAKPTRPSRRVRPSSCSHADVHADLHARSPPEGATLPYRPCEISWTGSAAGATSRLGRHWAADATLLISLTLRLIEQILANRATRAAPRRGPDQGGGGHLSPLTVREALRPTKSP